MGIYHDILIWFSPLGLSRDQTMTGHYIFSFRVSSLILTVKSYSKGGKNVAGPNLNS